MELKKAHEEHENDERWLITYADLITLLMVFFLVMYSMSRTDAEKFKQLASGLSQVFGKPAVSAVGVGGQPIAGNSIMPNKSEGDARKGTRHQKADGDLRKRRIQALKSDLDSLMAQRGISQSVTTKVDPRGPKLVMELADNLLFEPGSADLTPAAIELLRPVGEVLGARQYNIHVEGHTDDVPVSSGRFRNNFELSAARAVNVIMMLITDGALPPQLFSASGYGEYRPVASNDSAEGRAKNRRVDFVIYDENALDAMIGSSDSPATDEPLDQAPESAAPVSTPDAPAETLAPSHTEALVTNAPVASEPALAPDAASIAATSTHAPPQDANPSLNATTESAHSLSSIIALPQHKASAP
ncbi:MAG: flagellar motor protein MotB [Candidatus Hydrogenedentes bacterium]|nr:flagellar motor protein MotB [Candidatus Hydrogenedentota bacterium]